MMKNGKNIYDRLHKELLEFVESKAEELQNIFNEIFKNGKLNCFELNSGDIIYFEPKGEKLIFGGATNAGIIPQYEFDYDFDHDFDWNLQGMIEEITEQEEDYNFDESVEENANIRAYEKEFKDLTAKDGVYLFTNNTNYDGPYMEFCIAENIYDNISKKGFKKLMELLDKDEYKIKKDSYEIKAVHDDGFGINLSVLPNKKNMPKSADLKKDLKDLAKKIVALMQSDEIEKEFEESLKEEKLIKSELTPLPKKDAKFKVGDKVTVKGEKGEIIKVRPMKLSDTCVYDIKLEDGTVIDRYEEEINESLKDDYIDIVVPYDLATYISNGDRTPIDFDKETYEPMFNKADEYERLGDVEILDDTEDYDVMTDDFGFQNHVVTIRIHKNKNESLKENIKPKFKKGDIVRDKELNDLIIADVANKSADSEPLYMIDYYFPKGHERSGKFRKESELEKLSYTDLQQIKTFPRNSYIGSQKVKNESLKEEVLDSTTFDKTLLHKLMKECNAFLRNPNTENLWAKDIDKQIDALKKCLNVVNDTNLTIERLDKLKDRMNTAVAEVEPYGDFTITHYAKFSLGKPDKKEHITNMSLTDVIEYVKKMYLDELIKEYVVLTDNVNGEEIVRKDWDNEYIWNKKYHNPFDESLTEDMKEVADLYDIEYSEFNKNHKWDSYEDIPKEWEEFITDSNKTFSDAKRFLEKRYGLFIERLGDIIESAYIMIKVHSSPYNYKSTKSAVITLFRAEIVEINYIELAEKILKEVEDRYPEFSLKNESLKETEETVEDKLKHIEDEVRDEIEKIYGDDKDLMEYFVVESGIEKRHYDDGSDMNYIEVRAELDYDSMTELALKLDEIIRKYDKDAYFDQEEPGIMVAVIDFDRKEYKAPYRVVIKDDEETSILSYDTFEEGRDIYIQIANSPNRKKIEKLSFEKLDGETYKTIEEISPKTIGESLNESKDYPKMLSTLLRKCWYDGDGKFARNGKWSIGLGGYDHGYEVYYNGDTIVQIKPNNEVYFGRDERTIKEICGYGYEQILKAIQEVESDAFIAEDEYKLIITYDETYYNDLEKVIEKYIEDTKVVSTESGNGYYFIYSNDEDFLSDISAEILDTDKEEHFNTRIIEV